MKIDLNVPSLSLAPVERDLTSPATKGETGVQGEDRVTLRSSLGSVQTLTTQAMQSPSIRQDKVAALQSAIRDGSYQLDPGQIASAMIEDESGQR